MQNAKYLTRPSPEKSSLRPYTYSILTAACTCPIWGVVRYGHRKQYPTEARAMALEFGSAAHECFAAIFLWQVGFIQKLRNHMDYHGIRIFGADERFAKALYTKDKKADERDRLISLVFNILHSGNFYDDPFDNIRTITNLETGMIKYIDNVLPELSRWPIWIADKKKPEKAIGVECAFDIEIERRVEDNINLMRYVGQIDRLHEIERKNENHIIIGENKTGARLDDAWRLSFDMSHQVTGYMLGAATIVNKPVVQSRVHGLKNRQTGHSEDFNPISPLHRTDDSFETFIDWAMHSAEFYERYHDNWEGAPRYTHSCNRYFRPCSMLPFCTDTPDGRAQQFKEMIAGPLSPSEQAVLDRIGMLEI